ncbi:hypothetical protein RCH18_000418 [Flavobacterium sp. PL11]|jgi:hypothetical protein|uniref:OmpP1/FadL family transporter n=1 Tax=Flavobacterium sp. PL11 TaxID=3071717 RepID=UPI002DFF671A|nr:hypothetical protein [Flavobacterium sp. PL11]
MKKYIYLLALGFTASMVQSQEISDALLYSQQNLNGTARFSAMSGAFGALGGDLSSINVNPAGSAIFVNNQLGLTISNSNTKNNSNYFGTKASDKQSSFDLNQAGTVFVFNNKKDSDWTKISLGVNYENINNFDNKLFSSGTNPNNSVDKYFLSYANTGNNGAPIPQEFVNRKTNESISDLYTYLGNNLPNGFAAQQAMIAFYDQGFIIDAVDVNNPNSTYSSLVPKGGNYYQENSVVSTGYNGKLSFNAATSYKDKLFIGLNLNSHFTDLQKNSRFYEDNNAALTSDYTVSQIQFDNILNTYGNGFSFQVGAITKLTNEFRVGLAYESPTWLTLTDELSQKLTVVSSASNANDATEVVDPRVVNIYEPYKLQTPSKITGSLAYVFGKSGLISLDYAMKDYSNIKLKSGFDALNNDINSLLDNTGELRIGAEYRIKAVSFRGGYRYEQSPYKNGITIGDLTGYSAGLGYNFGSTKLDLAYSYAKRNTEQGFFGKGFTDGAKIDAISNNLFVTLMFEL